MAAKSYTLDNALLSHVLQNTAYVPPVAVFAGLFTVAPSGPSDAGTEVPTGGGTLYTRVAIPFGTGPVNGVISNDGAVNFPVAGAAWGGVPIVGVGIFSLVAGGTLLYYGLLGTPKTVGIGDSVSFAIGALSVQEQ